MPDPWTAQILVDALNRAAVAAAKLVIFILLPICVALYLARPM